MTAAAQDPTASGFSAVDASPNRDALIAYLDQAAAGLTAMKHYVAAAARRAVGGGLVLDLGCGAGHDLAILAAAGVDAVGLDPSEAMLAAARERLPVGLRWAPLVRADGALLPLRSGALDGCRLERVLIHVDDPSAVVAEVARVVRRGGFLAAFEPDWSTLRFADDDPDSRAVAAVFSRVRHPHVGGQLESLAEAHGFRVLDVVTEHSSGYAVADVPLPLEATVRQRVADGRLAAGVAERWLARQRELDAAGRFLASWDKVLVVATRR